MSMLKVISSEREKPRVWKNEKFVFLYELTKQKIREIVDALVKRNQISTWPMWKSDFRMGHVEI